MKLINKILSLFSKKKEESTTEKIQDPIIHEEVKEVLEEPKEQIIKNDEVLPNVKVEKPIKKTPKKKANPKKKPSEKKPIIKVEDTSEQKSKKRQPRKQSTKKKAE